MTMEARIIITISPCYGKSDAPPRVRIWYLVSRSRLLINSIFPCVPVSLNSSTSLPRSPFTVVVVEFELVTKVEAAASNLPLADGA